MPLHTLSKRPFNGEAPLSALRSRITPVDSFYTRSNFVEPELDADAWRLRVGGAVAETREWTLAEIQALGVVDRTVTLECAGNGRTFLEPPVEGTGWTLGATGTAVFTGTPLQRVLALSPPSADVVEWVFTGADHGAAGAWGDVRFQRSLPLDAVTAAPEPLLAWSMNGRPLEPNHGAPLRLVVPGWYAVASVKWLTHIEAVTSPFEGRFQTDRYLYFEHGEVRGPVTRMRVRALILDPAPGDHLAHDSTLTVSGIAWSGVAPVNRVEVSTDGGRTWSDAEVDPPTEPHTAQRWRWRGGRFRTPAALQLLARASDTSGARQPLEAWRNDLGYGNNQVHSVSVVTQPASPSS